MGIIRKDREPVTEQPLIGNPHLGRADPARPHPPVYDAAGGSVIGYLAVCPSCGGYYWAICPCGQSRGTDEHSY